MKDADALASGALPTSAGSTAGASGGSLGGASQADLQRGYSHLNDPDAGERCDCEYCTAERATQRQGFLGQPDPYSR